MQPTEIPTPEPAVAEVTEPEQPVVVEVTEPYNDPPYTETQHEYETGSEVPCSDTVQFPTADDSVFCENMAMCTALLQLVYVVASSIMFCSSVMLHAPSNMDALLGLTDLVVVDVTSASTVLLGIVCTHVYASSTATAEMYRKFFASVVIDMWVSTILSVLVGGLYQMSIKSLHVSDLGMTIAEGLTSVRLFDVNQSPHAPHSINTFAWPVLCVVLPAYALPATFRTTVWMHETLHEIGVLLIIFICVSGVLLVSIFASLHDESNIFYANASAVSYRWLEFNFGVNFYYLATINEPFTMTLMIFTQRVKLLIIAVYVGVWWAEFGVPVVNKPTCIRVYHFGSCMQDHPGVFLRGCFLGVCITSWMTHATFKLWNVHMSVTRLIQLQSVVLLCTPIFSFVKGALNMSFGDSIVNSNAALLSICMPVVVYTTVWAYNEYMKPQVQGEVMHICHETAVYCKRSGVVCGNLARDSYARVTRAFALRGSAGPPPG